VRSADATIEPLERLALAQRRQSSSILPDRAMKVTDKDVAHVADLASLELTEEERSRMLRDLNSILEYFARLSQLNTGSIVPMAQVSDRYGVDESRQGSDRFAYASRDDVKDGLRKSLPHDAAMKNAPETDGTFFEVPKVIER
jgi:aspartyl-tRNA(Asn)/glutamyl-tRNA(Gln) amidotransferase subunit C